MNIEQLEAIVAVVEQGSFRAAAESLHRSQPALSAAIKNLEEEFDLLIFDRSEYRPRLTEAGAAFLKSARTTLDAARLTARVARELGKNKAETKITLSVDPLVAPEILALIIQETARPTPPVDLVIEKSILHTGYHTLVRGEIDLAIAPLPAMAGDVEAIPLEKILLVGAVSKRLLQEKVSLTPSLLGSHPQVLTYDKRAEGTEGDGLPVSAMENGQKVYVPDHSTKLRLIESGVGWGRLCSKELDENPQLKAIPEKLFPRTELELCLLRAKYRPLGPVGTAIWNAFRTRAKNSKPRTN